MESSKTTAPTAPTPLGATYTSPDSQPFTHTFALPALSTAPTTEEKTAYLSSLRLATERLQENINRELTLRMEEDKARGEASGMAATGKKGKGGGVDETREEDNYGEEVVEED